jgi:hypothetical protein
MDLSRGLGDVYKRQIDYLLSMKEEIAAFEKARG